jgi:hypothetical protein
VGDFDAAKNQFSRRGERVNVVADANMDHGGRVYWLGELASYLLTVRPWFVRDSGLLRHRHKHLHRDEVRSPRAETRKKSEIRKPNSP